MKFEIKKIIRIGAMPTILILVVFALILANYGRVAYGLSISGFNLGGSSLEQAGELFKNKIGQFQNTPIVFQYQGKYWRLTPEQMGFIFPIEDNMNQIFSYGKEDILLAGISQQVQSALIGQNLELQYDIDLQKFSQSLTVFSELEKKPINASLEYIASSDQFKVSPSNSGILINRDKLIEGVIDNFSDAHPVQLVLTDTPAAITEQKADALTRKASELIQNAPVFLQSKESTWKINKPELASWLDLALNENSQISLSLNQAEIKNFLASAASAINSEPTNAQLKWKNDRIDFIVLARSGRKLNEETSIQKIKQGVLSGQKNIELAIDEIEPEVSNKNIDELGISNLLGRGESNFSGSTKNRIHNLTLGASKMNGLLVKPGEEFSFGQKIGAIDGQAGYLPELVIKNKQTIPEFGGGMCQVSTTLFRAALNSGLKITERHPHAYPVHYYDPPGFDATVYPPSPDLKFVNDTPNNILLQSRVEGNKLIFEIYGTADGRQAKIVGPTITYKGEDGSLRTMLKQQVWREGKMEREDKFPSYYKSADLYPVVKPTPSPAPNESPAPLN